MGWGGGGGGGGGRTGTLLRGQTAPLHGVAVPVLDFVYILEEGRRARERGPCASDYCRFHFASNGVNICVRAWHQRSVTDLHAKPRQFKPLTLGLHPVGLRGERLMNARSTPSRKYSRRSKRSEIDSIIRACTSQSPHKLLIAADTQYTSATVVGLKIGTEIPDNLVLAMDDEPLDLPTGLNITAFVTRQVAISVTPSGLGNLVDEDEPTVAETNLISSLNSLSVATKHINGVHLPIQEDRRERDYKYAGSIAAIDFGTASCSVAYCIQGDPSVRLLRLSTDDVRVPTSILTDANGKVIDFGKNARRKYGHLSREKRQQHHFFSEIKMKLQHDKVGI